MFIDFKEDAPIFAAIRVVGGPLTQRDVFAVQGALAEARRLQDDKPIFDIARELDDDTDGLSAIEVQTINDGLVAARAGSGALPSTVRGREIGPRGLALIKEFEGLRLKAYLCPAKVWTIGYGSTGPHVTPGLVMTEAQADALLQRDLDRFEDAVAKAAPGATQNQFDALTSFCFNVGVGALLKSTLLKMHTARNFDAAANEFLKWDKAGGRALAGLAKRRKAERNLYRAT